MKKSVTLNEAKQLAAEAGWLPISDSWPVRIVKDVDGTIWTMRLWCSEAARLTSFDIARGGSMFGRSTYPPDLRGSLVAALADPAAGR